jgi:hypothetical protein
MCQPGFVHLCTRTGRAADGKSQALTRPFPNGEEESAAHFGGGRVPLVLNPGHLNSTQTPFLHREGRVETGGCEFNRQGGGG